MSKYYDKIKSALSGREGEEFSGREVKAAVIKKYPACAGKEDSIMPSDYCYNRCNKDPSVIKKFKEWNPGQGGFLFIYNNGVYKYVGDNYAYSGEIFRKGKGEAEKVIGKWENGVLVSFNMI